MPSWEVILVLSLGMITTCGKIKNNYLYSALPHHGQADFYENLQRQNYQHKAHTKDIAHDGQNADISALRSDFRHIRQS